jgi:uncharacterized membrane protein
MADIIDSSFTGIDTGNLLPSFFQWMFGGSLNLENGSIWGVALLIVVSVSSFLMFKGFRYEKAMITSSVITWIVAFLALKTAWISNFMFTLSCIYVVLSIILLFEKSSSEEA